VSEVLSADELRDAIEVLPEVLGALLGDGIITATYGWGCNLHPDLCYLPMKVGTRWLERFVRDSLKQQIVVPGESDFWFSVPDKRLDLVFCHEGHIHVGGVDSELQAKLLEVEQFGLLKVGRAHRVPDA
jgi:hypothetical protein